MKVIGNTTRRFNLITNAIAKVVINPAIRVGVISTVIQVVWTITHVEWRAIKICELRAGVADKESKLREQ